MTIWTLQARISRQLLGWSAFNLTVGTSLLFAAPFWRGVGVQGLVWGIIDVAIAGFGLASLRRKRTRPDAATPERRSREARSLRRTLLVNAGLDVLYVVGGVIVLTRLTTEFAHGNGVGIIIQGGFLLVFDAFYALRVQRLETSL